MIKIIKNGEKPKKCKTIYIKECYHCKCKFEFEAEDCFELSRSIEMFSISLNTQYKINCPYCGIEICGYFNSTESRDEEIK